MRKAMHVGRAAGRDSGLLVFAVALLVAAGGSFIHPPSVLGAQGVAQPPAAPSGTVAPQASTPAREGTPVREGTAPREGAAPLDVVQVAPNVHVIAGDGGNIVVQTGTDGVVVVDSGAGARSGEVLAIVRDLSSQPIRFVINTSASRAHVGGNAVIAAAGTVLGGRGGRGGAPAEVAGVRGGAARLAHENVLLRMSAPQGQVAPFAEGFWPTEGFIDIKNLYLNGEAIQVTHQPAAHSDGDSLVFFRRSDVIVTGAIVDATRFPVIDVEAGGTVQGVIDALNRLVQLAVPPTPLVWQDGGTQVVPGRGHVLEQADLVEYRDMVTIVRDVVAELVRQGMTLEQVKAAAPAGGYATRYGSDPAWTTDMFVEAVYRTLPRGDARGGAR